MTANAGPFFGRLRGTEGAPWLLCWATALWIGSAPWAAGAAPSAAAAAISAITLERHCFGCPTGSVLVLRRDGNATYTTTGTERAGTADVTSTGTVGVKEFDELARLAVSQGFFELDDVYDDPDTRDGPWTTTRISRDGQDKQVFRRDQAGPASLKSIEAAIDALKTRVRFGP